MRAVSVRSAEVAFMRGVLDWRFSEIAAHYAYSEQAAQKAYGKALKDLQTALNGATSETTDAELLAREADLERLVAGRRYWLRQAMQLDARLIRLTERLAALEADARVGRTVLEVAAA